MSNFWCELHKKYKIEKIFFRVYMLTGIHKSENMCKKKIKINFKNGGAVQVYLISARDICQNGG